MRTNEIPSGVYWSREAGNFYDAKTNYGMGISFYNRWAPRKDEFPAKSTTVAGGLDLHLSMPVRPIEVQ